MTIETILYDGIILLLGMWIGAIGFRLGLDYGFVNYEMEEEE